MKKMIYLMVAVALLWSCEKDDNKLIDIKFNPPILDQYDIATIAFDDNGNTWAGTFNAHWPGDVNRPKLIRYHIKTGETTIWDSSNSPIRDSTYIWDIAVDSENTVWIGSESLLRFNGNTFTEYTTENSCLPVNMIREITEDSEGNIWFSSSRNREGGLVKFDGSQFTLFTPENSLLPLNGVAAVTTDKNNNIWIAQFGYLSEDQPIAKISGEIVTLITSEELGFFPVQWSDIEADSRNRIWIGHDYSYTSAVYNPRPQLLNIDGYRISKLSFDDTSNIKKIAVDHDDNLWCLTNDMLVVYNGSDWTIDSLTFRDGWTNDIEISKDNRIWVAASTGIYISR